MVKPNTMKEDTRAAFHIGIYDRPTDPSTVFASSEPLLGHVRLDTTRIYTQVSIRKLKEIHTATHPATVGEKQKAGAMKRALLVDLLAVADRHHQN